MLLSQFVDMRELYQFCDRNEIFWQIVDKETGGCENMCGLSQRRMRTQSAGRSTFNEIASV
jgi:hypothetical protein